MRRWGWLTALALAGCGTPWVESFEDEWRILRVTRKANGAGSLNVKIKPEPGETAFLATVEPVDPAQLCHIRFLQAGSDVTFRADEEVRSDRARTNAGFIGSAVSINWPGNGDDGLIVPVGHKVSAGIVNQDLVYTTGLADVTVLLKKDIDFTQGTLDVNVIFSGATGADGDLVRAVEDASELWRDLYRNIGIELEFSFFDFDGPGVLEGPGQGDGSAYKSLSSGVPIGGVNLVVLDDITGLGDIFGFAGDIPGPMIPTSRSAVAVSASVGAGPDGIFSARDTQLLAETMAHEVGHYLGLFHPVEVTYESWDSLEDTPECGAEVECINALGTNLMFPFPVCDSVSCIPQTQITGDQGGAANRYVGVH